MNRQVGEIWASWRGNYQGLHFFREVRMFGAIMGDMAGSVYEFRPDVSLLPEDINPMREDAHFTDDTVLTVAIADSCLHGIPYAESLRKWARAYPQAGYGGKFKEWFAMPKAPAYKSWGNGSAMRVSPLGRIFDSLDKTLEEAEKSASVTHNHPEGIKGAQAIAASIYLARSGVSKKDIKQTIVTLFGYQFPYDVEALRAQKIWDVSCQVTVPQALTAFFEGDNFLHTLRLAISMGGDCDTLACMAGSVAEAFYGGIPDTCEAFVVARLPAPMQEVVNAFQERFPLSGASCHCPGVLPGSP